MEQTKPVEPIENVNSSVWKYIRDNYLPYVIGYICVSVGVIYFFPNQFTIFAVFIVGSIGYSTVYTKIKREFTQEFGNSIGFTYSENAGLDTVSGKLFKTGHSQSIFDVLSGVYQNIPMRIFSFRFTIGEGKSSHTYSYTVFEATLNGKVPDILLFSKSHGSAVSDWFSGDETIELEGDFNKYFKLRVPKGYEEEAYQVFTPDVMADLIDKAKDVSFELTGNKLYIYATSVITDRKNLQSMFDLSEYLVGLFEKSTATVETVTLGQ